MRTLFVTAADESYAPLLRGLVQSLYQWEPRPFTDLACFDLGLSSENRQWIERHAAHVVEPAWNLPVDERLRTEQPALRSLTVRPFLPHYFPGYDIYVWIDTDTWVQERFALDWYIAAAAHGALAATPQVHHTYRHTVRTLNWRTTRMQACFGHEAVQQSLWETYFNAGVFALRTDAPHWDIWAKSFHAGLEASHGRLCCDQTALNHAIWTKQLRVNPLPAVCNWLCHLATPRFDVSRKRFCEPAAPGHPIGILHLSANTKDSALEVRNEGNVQTISLRYPGASMDMH